MLVLRRYEDPSVAKWVLCSSLAHYEIILCNQKRSPSIRHNQPGHSKPVKSFQVSKFHRSYRSPNFSTIKPFLHHPSTVPPHQTVQRPRTCTKPKHVDVANATSIADCDLRARRGAARRSILHGNHEGTRRRDGGNKWTQNRAFEFVK